MLTWPGHGHTDAESIMRSSSSSADTVLVWVVGLPLDAGYPYMHTTRSVGSAKDTQGEKSTSNKLRTVDDRAEGNKGLSTRGSSSESIREREAGNDNRGIGP